MRVCALLFVFVMASAFFFLAMAPHGFSYEYYSEYNNKSLGEVVDISVNPAKPKVLDDTVATVVVHNLKDYSNEYTLRIFVSMGGQVIEQNDITFSLNANKNMSMTMDFLPTKIGTYSVIAKIFNKDTTALYSEKVLDVEVVSDIGPFDMQLDVLSHTLRPGYVIPLLLSMKNMGIRGTDVDVSITMDCASQGRIYKDFSVYLGGNGELQKTVSLSACSDKGYHEITAKILMLGGVVAQSTSSVFINDTQYNIYVRCPDFIEIGKGFSKNFDVYVMDDDNRLVNNLRAIISDLPQDWLSITPESVASIRPNESAIFVVNISAPPDAASAEYPFTISIGGDEVLMQRDAVLNIFEVGGATQNASEPQPVPAIDIEIPMIEIEIAGMVATMAVIIIAIKSRNSQNRTRKGLS